MSTWKQRLLTIRRDVFSDVTKTISDNRRTLTMLTRVLSVEEAEEALKWGGLVVENTQQFQQYEFHLAWDVVGCAHRNFLSPKTALLSWSMQHGAHPGMRNQKQNNLLHECTDASLVDFLLEAGVDVKASNEDGKTPLHCAMLYGAWDVACELIKNKAPMFSSEYVVSQQTKRQICAGLAILLCCEYYNSNPSFAPVVWRYLRPQFEWEDVQEHHRLFLTDMSRFDLTKASWIKEALESLSCYKRAFLPHKETTSLMLLGEGRGPSYYVACDSGIRTLFSHLFSNPKLLPLNNDISDAQGRNILHYAFEHFCSPLVEHVACYHSYLFQPDYKGNTPVSFMPHTARSALYTSFCPDLLLQGCLDAVNHPANKNSLKNALDIGQWPRFEMSHQKQLSDIVSSEAYNALLAEALREHIHQQVWSQKGEYVEMRKM